MKFIISFLALLLALMPVITHAAADINMHTTTRVVNSGPNGMMGMVVTNVSNIYLIFVTNDRDRILAVKSSTGGAFWGAEATVATESATDIRGMSIWYDQWTDDITGTRIHIAWNDARNTLKYAYLDTGNDTISAPVTIATSGASLAGDQRVNIVKTLNGHLFAHTSNGATQIFYRSTNNGVAWGSRTSTGACTQDQSAYSAYTPTVDPANFLCWGISGGIQINRSTYNGTTDSWSVTNAIATFTNAANLATTYVRGTVYLALVDDVGADYTLRTWRYSTDTGVITTTGNVFANQVNYASTFQSISIMKSDLLDRVYLFYRGAGGDLVNSVFSTDEMATWSVVTRVDDSATNVGVPLASVQDSITAGGRVCVSWRNGDDGISNVNTGGCFAILPPAPPEHWFLSVRDRAGFSDTNGNLVWLALATITVIFFFVIVKAPAIMIGIMVAMTVVAFISLNLLDPVILISGALLLAFIAVIVVVKKAGSSE